MGRFFVSRFANVDLSGLPCVNIRSQTLVYRHCGVATGTLWRFVPLSLTCLERYSVSYRVAGLPENAIAFRTT